MKTRMILIAMLALLLFGAVIAPVSTAFAQVGVPVTGTLDDGSKFVGTLKITKFTAKGGALTAVGQLSGTLTGALGNVIGTVKNVKVTIPVTAISGTCDILHLELGPLDLNLLGLVVHLDKVVLDIDAQQGGGLLGDLLCAVANLLNTGGPLSSIANLLNQILDILG